jgi:hypothetical protein
MYGTPGFAASILGENHVGVLLTTVQGRHDFNEVCDAIQPKIPNAGTKYGKMPYKVSLAEWEWRSTARNTRTQNKQVAMIKIQASQEMGR